MEKQPDLEHTVFTNSIVKTRDEKGNATIHGGTGNQYYIISKKSTIAKGNLCRIKLCSNKINDE